MPDSRRTRGCRGSVPHRDASTRSRRTGAAFERDVLDVDSFAVDKRQRAVETQSLFPDFLGFQTACLGIDIPDRHRLATIKCQRCLRGWRDDPRARPATTDLEVAFCAHDNRLAQRVNTDLKADARILSSGDLVEDCFPAGTGNRNKAATVFAVVAQRIESFLNRLDLGQFGAARVVVAYIASGNIRERWKLLAAVFDHARNAARHLQQSEPAVVMLDSERRLRGWIRVRYMIRRPLDIAGRGSRGDQPVVARAVAACGEIDFYAAFHFYQIS